MPRKKTNRKADVKKLVERLVKKEFGDYLLGVRFDGPYEEEDIDFDLLLKEEPNDYVERAERIYERLGKAGFYVLFSHDVWYELEEDEKQNWQSLWTPVNLEKPKAKTR